MNEEMLLRLSPPWYTFFNYIKHSIGADRYVDVLDMKELSNTRYLIQVDVKVKKKAAALAAILVTHRQFGNINVCVEVMHNGQVVKPVEQTHNVCSLISVLEAALETNDYFEFAKFEKIFSAAVIFPVFKKAVIQFFNDDLSDLYNNFNGVAANVFEEVIKSPIDDVFIYPSTAKAIKQSCK